MAKQSAQKVIEEPARENVHIPPENLTIEQARVLLNTLIAAPPLGSVPMRIGRDLALAMLEHNGPNRPLSSPRVKRYTDILRRGEWRHNGETIKFSTCGLLIDGQHRLHAIARAGLTVTTDVRFGLARDTFDTIDTGRNRTAADVLAIRQIPNSRVVASGARLYWRYEQPVRMARNDPSHPQIEDTIERHPLLLDGARVADRLRQIGLYTSTVTFVWTLAAEYDRAKADEFFDKVASGLGLTDRSDPIYRLREFAAANKSNRRVNAEDMAAVMVKAWQAFLEGRRIKYLRWRRDGNCPEAFPVAPSRANQ